MEDFFDFVRCQRNDGKGFYGTAGKCNPKVGKEVPKSNEKGTKVAQLEGMPRINFMYNNPKVPKEVKKIIKGAMWSADTEQDIIKKIEDAGFL